MATLTAKWDASAFWLDRYGVLVALMAPLLLAGCCSTPPSSTSAGEWAKLRSPTDAKVLLVTSLEAQVLLIDDRGEVFVSDDVGVSWRRVVAALPDGKRVRAAFACDREHLWVARGYHTDEFEEPLEVFRGALSEGSWSRVYSQQRHNRRVCGIRFWDDRHGVLLAWHASTWGGCRASDDGGKSWADLEWPVAATIVLDREQYWGIGKQNSILRTTDGGSRWTSIFEREWRVWEIKGVSLLDSSRGFVFGVSGSPDDGYSPLLGRTRDAGTHWEEVSLPKSVVQASPAVTQALFADDEEGWIVLREGFGQRVPGPPSSYILHTKDGGRTWQREWSGAESIDGLVQMRRMGLWAFGEGGLLIMRKHPAK